MLPFRTRPGLLAVAALAFGLGHAQPARAADPKSAVKVAHRTVKIDGLDIFYREAGPKDAPTILLLHGSQPRRTCSAT